MFSKLRLVFALLVVLVMAAQVSAQTGGISATVVPFELNVRAQPSAAATLLGVFKQGETVTVTGRETIPGNFGQWVYATDGTLTGWVLADYLTVRGSVSGLPVLSVDGATSSTTTTTTTGTGSTTTTTSAVGGALTGTTTTIVNFRGGPGLSFSVVAELPTGTAIALDGRNGTGTWVHGNVNGEVGWVFARLLTYNGDKNTLPVIGSSTSSTSSSSTSITIAPGETTTTTSSGGIISGVGPRAREIYLVGQQLGNRRDVFSKVGDSMTATSLFLTPIGDYGAHLYNYAHLQGVIDFYVQTTARTYNSFGNKSFAASDGFTSAALIENRNNIAECPQMSPLVCEYTMVKPAVALIMVGTNDVNNGVPASTYRGNLEVIVETSIDMGVIPVISTIPDSGLAAVLDYNNAIRRVAQNYQIPLWDYWEAMQSLPNRGLSNDNVHPSSGGPDTAIFAEGDLKYGFNMRNLTALMALDAVWRGALY
jgi:uncharacterized protein YraI